MTARRFHTALGIVVLIIYVYVMWRHTALLPNLAAGLGGGPSLSTRSGGGSPYVYALPPAAIVCFLWPDRLMYKFSPRTPPEYDYLLTEGFWYALGYLLLSVGTGVMLLFR